MFKGAYSELFTQIKSGMLRSRKEGIDSASRAEAGNEKYDYYFPVDDNDELLLVEKWKDAEAIIEHGKQPHFKRLGELKADYVDETIIERFET